MDDDESDDAFCTLRTECDTAQTLPNLLTLNGKSVQKCDDKTWSCRGMSYCTRT